MASVGCRNLGRLDTALVQRRRQPQRWEVGAYRGMDEISKYIKNDGSEVSHCGKREVPTWKEKNRMKPVWCCIQLKGLV